MKQHIVKFILCIVMLSAGIFYAASITTAAEIVDESSSIEGAPSGVPSQSQQQQMSPNNQNINPDNPSRNTGARTAYPQNKDTNSGSQDRYAKPADKDYRSLDNNLNSTGTGSGTQNRYPEPTIRDSRGNYNQGSIERRQTREVQNNGVGQDNNSVADDMIRSINNKINQSISNMGNSQRSNSYEPR